MGSIFSFAVVIWISDARDYAVSAIVITALIGVLLGCLPISPNLTGCSAHAVDYWRCKTEQNIRDEGSLQTGGLCGQPIEHSEQRRKQRTDERACGTDV